MEKDPIYEPNGKITIRKAVPFGLQHVLAMFVANIAPILIVAGAVKMDPAESAAACLVYRKRKWESGSTDRLLIKKETVSQAANC